MLWWFVNLPKHLDPVNDKKHIFYSKKDGNWCIGDLDHIVTGKTFGIEELILQSIIWMRYHIKYTVLAKIKQHVKLDIALIESNTFSHVCDTQLVKIGTLYMLGIYFVRSKNYDICKRSGISLTFFCSMKRQRGLMLWMKYYKG